MADIYTRITGAPASILGGLMAALETRAADPQQRGMLQTYLTDAALPPGARVLEVGCGTGAVTRALAAWPGVSEAVGVDPSPVFLARARELARTLTTRRSCVLACSGPSPSSWATLRRASHCFCCSTICTAPTFRRSSCSTFSHGRAHSPGC